MSTTDLYWTASVGGREGQPPFHLRVGSPFGPVVGVVNERVDGQGWVATVNRQHPDPKRHYWALAGSEAQAKRWVERWIRPRLGVLVGLPPR